MQLIKRCIDLENKISRLHAARMNANARATVNQRLQEWQTHLDRIEQSRRRLDWLGVSPNGDATLASSLAATRALAVEACARLTETRDIESVRTADALWTRLLASAKNCSEALEAAVLRHWREAVRLHGDFDSSANLRQRAPDTPGNKRALEDYQRVYAVYQRLASASGPSSAQTLDQIARQAEDLRAILKKIDFNVPPEVQAFFAALEEGGAGLELINPRLIDWLRIQGQLNRYVVRDRRG